MGKDGVEVDKIIVRYRVLGEYLGIRTSDNRLFLFFKPSFIGYAARSHVGAGVGLIFLGVVIAGVTYALGSAGYLSKGLAGFLSLIVFILGLSFIVGGIILLLWKERSLVIETHAGTQIRFKNPGITDRDIGAIFSQFAEEYKKKPEAEKQSTQQP